MGVKCPKKYELRSLYSAQALTSWKPERAKMAAKLAIFVSWDKTLIIRNGALVHIPLDSLITGKSIQVSFICVIKHSKTQMSGSHHETRAIAYCFFFLLLINVL